MVCADDEKRMMANFYNCDLVYLFYDGSTSSALWTTGCVGLWARLLIELGHDGLANCFQF